MSIQQIKEHLKCKVAQISLETPEKNQQDSPVNNYYKL